VPLAVITGWGEAVSSDEQLTAQVNWVVTKPFKVRHVTDIMAEISLRRTNSFRSMPAVAMNSAGSRTI
jgi:hypothetical protein